jgi:hypothetical protein
MCFCNNLHRVQIQKIEIIWKSLGAIKPKGLNTTGNMNWGYIYVKDEKLSVNNNYII